MLSFYTQTDLFFYYKVKKAQQLTLLELSPEIEFYSVHLLSRLTNGIPTELQEPLFEKLDNANNSSGMQKYLKLKDLGDTCLVLLTRFPDFIKKKGLSYSYYRDMGQLGYSRAGDIADRYLDGDYSKILWQISDKFCRIEKVLRKAQELRAPDNVEGIG